MGTNLQLKAANFVRVEGYFYHVDITGDTLYKKTDDGTNAFSYPLDSDITNTVQSLQYDGRYFYTLENNITANSNYGQLLIKRWEIDDYILKLRRTWTLNGVSSQKYDCNAFAIENFSLTVSGAFIGNDIITLSNNSRVAEGDIVYIGPSLESGYLGQYEEKQVAAVLPANQVQFTSVLTKSFTNGNKAIFSNNCWLFNKYIIGDTLPSGTGQLFKFPLNPLGINLFSVRAGNDIKNVLAASYTKDTTTAYGGTEREYLVYINQANLFFIETDPDHIDYGISVLSAAQNNQGTDSTILTIFDITFEGNNIFRLQQKATFRNNNTYTTEDWGTNYNYQLATLQRLPSSISLVTDKGIISADGQSTTTIYATVRDQFNHTMQGRTVYFSEDDSSGSPQGVVSPVSSGTNSNGIATTVYTAGTIPKVVTLTSST